MPKGFEKNMQKQVVSHINTFLSPCMYGYRKEFSTKYALLSLLERLKRPLIKKGFAGDGERGGGTLFDLEFLMAKLHVYRFCKDSLMLLLSYLLIR